jgi:glycosyltransferase involved in cell wall biosynthesis
MTKNIKPLPTLAIVIPCFNEGKALRITISELQKQLNTLIIEKIIANNSFLYFVDDGSNDDTWILIEKAHQDINAKGHKLAINYGHQQALLSGLLSAQKLADCIISIDADLQDNPTLMKDMVNAYKDGNEVVYVINTNRDSDSFFKRTTATIYYRLLNLLHIQIINNHADYRLLGSRALSSLRSFNERNLFLRGIVPLLGGKFIVLTQIRKARNAGEAKYNLKKMLTLAWDGVTSFSIAPLRLMLTTGVIAFIFSIFLSAYVLWGFFFGIIVPGWASTTLPIYMFGGLQLLGTGLIGEYLGKIYLEVKQRPRFIVEKELN